jgi:predicted Zn-dependent peptidase
LDKLKNTPVTDAELQKAVKQFVSATLSARKTMQGQAQDLGGNWLAAGDLNFSQRYLAAVQRITPADLQRVARHYLTPENRTLYALLPEGTTPKTAALTESNTDHAIQKFTLPTASSCW